VDPAGGTTFAQVTKVRNVQAPPQNRASIDVTAMEDTAAASLPGIHEESEFSFEFLWDDADATDEDLQDLYTSGDVAAWKIAYTDGTNTWAMTFSGWVKALEPAAVSGSDPVVMRLVGQRTGAITNTFT
jgi:hypothetical protein